MWSLSLKRTGVQRALRDLCLFCKSQITKDTPFWASACISFPRESWEARDQLSGVWVEGPQFHSILCPDSLPLVYSGGFSDFAECVPQWDILTSQLRTRAQVCRHLRRGFTRSYSSSPWLVLFYFSFCVPRCWACPVNRSCETLMGHCLDCEERGLEEAAPSRAPG